MPTRPKPFAVLTSEKKSHRTKAELEDRQKQESALLTGTPMTEWDSNKADPVAHEEFLRVRRLLRSIEKNDDLYGNCLNRYARLYSECLDFVLKREVFYKRAAELDKIYAEQDPDDKDIKPLDYFKLSAQLQSQVVACDKQVQAKRKMMLDIEKENIMTISSALRSIPKKVDEEDEDDPMAQMLARRNSIV